MISYPNALEWWLSENRTVHLLQELEYIDEDIKHLQRRRLEINGRLFGIL